MIKELIGMIRPWCLIISGMLSVMACSGGQKAETLPSAVDLPAPAATAMSEKPAYLISPGDELEIRFFYTPDLNITVPVRPDGFVSLPIAKEVKVAGFTPEEVRSELCKRYSEELADPEIAVILRSFSSARVHVGGEVKSPGVLPLAGPTTVVQAIFEAGGALRTAYLAQVIVIRPLADNTYTAGVVDVKRILDGSDMSQNIALAPNDAVYVPKSPIANMNDFIDMYIRQNIPLNLRFDLN